MRVSLLFCFFVPCVSRRVFLSNERRRKTHEKRWKEEERKARSNSTGCRQRNKTPRCLYFFFFLFFYSLATRNGGVCLSTFSRFFFLFSFLLKFIEYFFSVSRHRKIYRHLNVTRLFFSNSVCLPGAKI